MSLISIRSLGKRDLEAINAVITQAVMAWPLPERMKRLSLPLLRYDEVDLAHFDGVVARAPWQAENDPGLAGVALFDDEMLHGLYVHPEAQGRGIGRALLGAVCARASENGVQRLLVKAERVSAGYFRRQGLTSAGSESAYPHAFYLSTTDSFSRPHPARVEAFAGLSPR